MFNLSQAKLTYYDPLIDDAEYAAEKLLTQIHEKLEHELNLELATQLVAAMNDIHKGRDEFPALLARYRSVEYDDEQIASKDDKNDKGVDMNMGTENAESRRALQLSEGDSGLVLSMYEEMVGKEADLEDEVQLKGSAQILEHAKNVCDESNARRRRRNMLNGRSEIDFESDIENECANASRPLLSSKVRR